MEGRNRKLNRWQTMNMGAFNFNEAEFEKIRDQAEEFYKTIGQIYCPYFGAPVAFNAKGLRHLKFKSDQQARS